MRVLVALTPLMYREAIAHSLSQHRPALEVRIAAPEVAQEDLKAFAPHLLVHSDTDGPRTRSIGEYSLLGGDRLLRQHGRLDQLRGAP
jgi:hypothetical protein